MSSPPTVLVVDDDTDIRELVVFWLEHEGFAVRSEADGEAGLEAALTGGVDLAVIDWMMPRLDGLELCRRLRADPLTARLPIVMLTARAQPADADAVLAAGADAYLAKPLSRAELGDCVRTLLARSTRSEPPRMS